MAIHSPFLPEYFSYAESRVFTKSESAGTWCGGFISSVCLTGAMWYVMTTKKQKKDAVEKQAKKDAEKAAKEAKKSGK